METGPDLPRDEPSGPAVPVSRAVRCEIGFVSARLRLLTLLHSGFLHSACSLACESALAMYHGRGPRRLTRPPAVSIGEPESGRGAVTVPVCCGTDLGSGRPGRVLDAELTFLAAAGGTEIRLDGGFRLPARRPASRAAAVARATRAAQSGAESLLTFVAEALAGPDKPEPSPRPGWRWITSDSQELPRSTPAAIRGAAGLPIRMTS